VDFWHRAQPGIDVAEHLVLAGGFDALYGIGAPRRSARTGA
jgi:error-prone DNA polymerase